MVRITKIESVKDGYYNIHLSDGTILVDAYLTDVEYPGDSVVGDTVPMTVKLASTEVIIP